MKTKHIKLVTTLMSGVAFMTMPFQTLQAQTTTTAEPDNLPGIGVQPDEYFFTGKPYDEDLGGVIFLYRNYDVETNRWMSSDPSGFPDGPNNQFYAPVPLVAFDSKGLALQLVTSNVDWFGPTSGEEIVISEEASGIWTGHGAFFTMTLEWTGTGSAPEIDLQWEILMDGDSKFTGSVDFSWDGQFGLASDDYTWQQYYAKPDEPEDHELVLVIHGGGFSDSGSVSYTVE